MKYVGKYLKLLNTKYFKFIHVLQFQIFTSMFTSKIGRYPRGAYIRKPCYRIRMNCFHQPVEKITLKMTEMKEIVLLIACFPLVLLVVACALLRDTIRLSFRKLFRLKTIEPELVGVPERLIVPNKPKRKSRDRVRRKSKDSESSIPEVAAEEEESIPESFSIEPWMEMEANRREISRQADHILYLEQQNRLATRRITRLKSWVRFLSDKSAKMTESSNGLDAEISQLRYENKKFERKCSFTRQRNSKLTAAPPSNVVNSTSVITREKELVPQPEKHVTVTAETSELPRLPRSLYWYAVGDSLPRPPNPVDKPRSQSSPLRVVPNTLDMASGVEIPFVPDNTSSKPELTGSSLTSSQSQPTLEKSDEIQIKKTRRKKSKPRKIPDEVTITDNKFHIGRGIFGLGQSVLSTGKSLMFGLLSAIGLGRLTNVITNEPADTGNRKKKHRKKTRSIASTDHKKKSSREDEERSVGTVAPMPDL